HQVERYNGRTADLPDGVQHSSHGDVVDVVASARGQRAVLPPASHPGVDQTGIELQTPIRADAQPFGYARAEALDQYIGSCSQLQRQLQPGRILQVSDDRPASAQRPVAVSDAPCHYAWAVDPDDLSA